jgi:hypothetical protein
LNDLSASLIYEIKDVFFYRLKTVFLPKRKPMDRDTIIHSSLFEIPSLSFSQGDEYISDIELITLSDTGIIDAQISNITLNESCMMLVNAIKVFRMGFFDCAFYSLRQTIELSIGGIYLYSNKEQIKEWNKGKDGFEKGRMAQLLKKNDSTFSNVREKLSFYFEALRDAERHIDKYVHKQGIAKFYTYHDRTPNYYRNHQTKIINDFDKYLRTCIGAVLVYRLVIDPLPLLLADEEIAYRSPDFVTVPFGKNLVDKYLSDDIVSAYKQTDIYQGFYEDLSAREKQNEAVFNLIHWQSINRNCANEYEEQVHLLSMHDRLAIIIAFSSIKVSNCYLMNGFSWYFTETNSLRKSNSIALGDCYFQSFFTNEHNYNLPFENVFISRCRAFGETHYFEHNHPLVDQEIDLIEKSVIGLNKTYIESNEMYEKWFNEQIKQHNSNE